MKKRHLLSLLALGISTACYGETYPAPIGPSHILRPLVRRNRISVA